jgi:PST family polysaccharide transporter
VSLRARVAVGLGWTGGAHWFGVVTATVTTAVVARYLVPEDFAVVAAAGALAGVLGALQESGIAAAVVQHAGDGARAATTGLLLNLAGATAGFAVCLALTPWLAAFFQIQEPAALAVAFSPLWLRAWMNVPLARLQKALDFRRCALVEAAQVLTYPALTIPLAVTGAGTWALVVGQAAAAAAGALAAWLLSTWRPRLRDFDWETGRALLRYGRPLVWSNLLGMANDRVDNWVVGRVLGPAALGLYVMAFRLATLPRTGFTFVVSRVLFPTMTALQGDERRMREAFLRALHWVAACAIPASVGLALLAPDIVAVALGPGWAGVVTPLRVLTGFALVASLAATTGDVFKATGRSVLIFRIGLVHSVVLWTGLALLAPRGIAWTGLAVSIAATVSGAAAFACALAALRIRPGALARVLATPVAATLVMVAALAALGRIPVGPGAVRLVASVLVGVAAYAGAHALLAPADVREVGGALAAFRGRRARPPGALAAG